jgi:hypothetical protein
MEPAQTIIRKLGGPSAVAAVVGIHRTRVSSWQRSRASGGTGGRVPQDHIPVLLDHARRNGIALTADEFLAVAAQRRGSPKPRRAAAKSRAA